MENYIWIIWLVLMVAAIVLEMLSFQLFSLWFAVGALAAMLSSFAGAEIWVQVVVFVGITGVSLALSRPLVKKLQKKAIATNADRLVGRPAAVIEEINNAAATGAIKVEGQIWTARTREDGLIIPIGEQVVTDGIEGVKMFVKRPENVAETLDIP